MIHEMRVGNGRVVLIAGGGKTYCDSVVSFCGSNKDIEEILTSPQNKRLIKEIINSDCNMALEFDDFIFGIQGYAKASEIQMVRERMASYVIKNGIEDDHGKCHINTVVPDSIRNFHAKRILNPENIVVKFSNIHGIAEVKLIDCFPLMKRQFAQTANPTIVYDYDYRDILDLIDSWYTEGISKNISEEDLCYMKPQAAEFKAAIKINATNLRKWAYTKMCNCAPFEIRDLVTKMVKLAKNVAPDLMEGVGPSCVVNGFCTEATQCKQFKDKVPTKQQVFDYINTHKQEILKG